MVNLVPKVVAGLTCLSILTFTFNRMHTRKIGNDFDHTAVNSDNHNNNIAQADERSVRFDFVHTNGQQSRATIGNINSDDTNSSTVISSTPLQLSAKLTDTDTDTDTDTTPQRVRTLPTTGAAATSKSCQAWSCDCQNLSNTYDTWHNHWGDADDQAKVFWMKHRCQTFPGGNTSSFEEKARQLYASSCVGPGVTWITKPHNLEGGGTDGVCRCDFGRVCVGTRCMMLPNLNVDPTGGKCNTSSPIPSVNNITTTTNNNNNNDDDDNNNVCVSLYARGCSDCKCVGFDDAKQVWESQPKNVSEKYVAYNLNSGRLGNQMMTINYAFQVALALGRTVVMRCRGAIVGYKDKVGLQPDNGGLWDVENIAQRFEMVFDDSCGITQATAVAGVRIIDFGSDSILSNRLNYCGINHFVESIKHDRDLSTCLVIDLDGSLGFVRAGDIIVAKNQFSFWNVLRPVKTIRDFVANKLSRVQLTKPSFAVHHRNSVIERYPANYKKKDEGIQVILRACEKHYIKGEREMLWLTQSTEQGPFDKNKSLGPEEIGMMCTLKVSELEQMLHSRDVIVNIRALSNSSESKKWFLLDDFSMCDHQGFCPHLQNDLFAHGAITMCPTPHWARGWVCDDVPELVALATTAADNYTAYTDYHSPVVDQWLAVQMDFFIGLTGSTFDVMVCGMRGIDRVDNSTMCRGWHAMQLKRAKKFLPER